MHVADVDGVRLAGFLIDAGPATSDTLLRIGTPGASADHSADPTSVQDVFIRIGGAGPGRATNSVVVDSDDVLIDHTWIWRADHGDGVGWDTNRADYGLRVNGDDVLATGLFVEHFNKYDVHWNGERGRDDLLPEREGVRRPERRRRHPRRHRRLRGLQDRRLRHHPRGVGPGQLLNYTADPSIVQAHGFQTPVTPGIKLHNLLVVSSAARASTRTSSTAPAHPPRAPTPSRPR